MVISWIIGFIANGFSFESYKTDVGFLVMAFASLVSFVVVIIYLVKLIVFLFEHIKFV